MNDDEQYGVSYHGMCLFLLHRATFCRAGDACDNHQVVTEWTEDRNMGWKYNMLLTPDMKCQLKLTIGYSRKCQTNTQVKGLRVNKLSN